MVNKIGSDEHAISHVNNILQNTKNNGHHKVHIYIIISIYKGQNKHRGNVTHALKYFHNSAFKEQAKRHLLLIRRDASCNPRP